MERETKTSFTKTFLIPSSNSFSNFRHTKTFSDCFTCASGFIWQLPLIFYIYMAACIKSGPGGKKQKDRLGNAAKGRPGLQTSDSSYRLNAKQRSSFLQASKDSGLQCVWISCASIWYTVLLARQWHHVLTRYVITFTSSPARHPPARVRYYQGNILKFIKTSV